MTKNDTTEEKGQLVTGVWQKRRACAFNKKFVLISELQGTWKCGG
jgi:hypothetical protein